MTYLAAWLLTLGIGDLLRARRDHVESRHVALIAAAAVCMFVSLSLAVGTASGRGLLLTALCAAGLVVWIVASAAALNHQGRRGGSAERRVALGALATPILILLVTSGRVPVDGGVLNRWYAGLDIPALGSLPFETFLLGCGLLVFQVSSANIVVRMVLDSVGSPAESGEQTLKGGRLLGPMERIFILGLGLAGDVTAASIVIAAKGLLRYPEIQHSQSSAPELRGQVSEYFLVGSFTSWLIAMAGLPLV